MTMRALIPFSRDRSLARWEPSVFGILQREVDRLFDDFGRGIGANGNLVAQLTPNMDIAETDKEIELSVELPGLERKDIDISLEDNTLILRGEKKLEQERKDKNYQVMERGYGSFYRAITLPPGIDPATIQAVMSKGVLKVTIPKSERLAEKKIEVKEDA